MERFGASPERGRIYRERPGVYAVILHGDWILLSEQDGLDAGLHLPGGGIDPGEQTLRALHREVAEETGWTIQPRRRLGTYQRYTYMPEYDRYARKICTLYLCSPGRRRGPAIEAGHWAHWTDLPTAAQSLVSPGDRAWVSRLASSAPFQPLK